MFLPKNVFSGSEVGEGPKGQIYKAYAHEEAKGEGLARRKRPEMRT